MSMVDCKCEWCRKPMQVRAADRKRGWGRYCSKQCKAKHQESRTGQNRAYQDRQQNGPTFSNAHQFHDENY